jgi:hypothetical protein
LPSASPQNAERLLQPAPGLDEEPIARKDLQTVVLAIDDDHTAVVQDPDRMRVEKRAGAVAELAPGRLVRPQS